MVNGRVALNGYAKSWILKEILNNDETSCWIASISQMGVKKEDKYLLNVFFSSLQSLETLCQRTSFDLSEKFETIWKFLTQRIYNYLQHSP